MKKLFTALLITCFVLISIPAQAASLQDVRSLVEQYYVDELSPAFYEATTIDELMATLDPYSAYFSPMEYEQYVNDIDLESVGIGIYFEQHPDGAYITDTIEHSPAAQAGLIAGSIILQADGHSLAAMTQEQMSAILSDAAGTVVTLTVRLPTNAVQTYTITRQAFQTPKISSSLLYGNIGYIALYTFSDDADTLMRRALSNLREQGATSYIIDLRNNGGGYVVTAEKIIGMFTNSPLAYLLHTKNQSQLYSSVGTYRKFPLNSRLLVNEYSASASEMTAAALQDQQAAILYGQKTYGKGSMQQFLNFSDGSYLKLTIATFTGPNGKPIHEKGVIPDIVTKSPLEDAHFDALSEKLQYTIQPTLTKDAHSATLYIVHKQIASTAKNHYHFVQLGTNKKLAFSAAKSGKRYARLTFNEPLKAGAMYALITEATDTQPGKIQKIIVR